MSKFEKKMQELFDIDASNSLIDSQKPSPPKVLETVDEKKLEQDLNADYQTARDNLQEIIEKGKDALDGIINVAKNSDHPRAYEVVATMLKNVTEANEKLLTMQKQMREVNKSLQKESNKTTIDKAIFVGSTSDLQKFLKNNNDN
jgi:uncharacterized protein YwgA